MRARPGLDPGERPEPSQPSWHSHSGSFLGLGLSGRFPVKCGEVISEQERRLTFNLYPEASRLGFAPARSPGPVGMSDRGDPQLGQVSSASEQGLKSTRASLTAVSVSELQRSQAGCAISSPRAVSPAINPGPDHSGCSRSFVPRASPLLSGNSSHQDQGSPPLSSAVRGQQPQRPGYPAPNMRGWWV